jgi:hypothetical protein
MEYLAHIFTQFFIQLKKDYTTRLTQQKDPKKYSPPCQINIF